MKTFMYSFMVIVFAVCLVIAHFELLSPYWCGICTAVVFYCMFKGIYNLFWGDKDSPLCMNK